MLSTNTLAYLVRVSSPQRLDQDQVLHQGILKGYNYTIDLLFDWFGISCMSTDNFCFYLQNRPIQTSQTGGQWYSVTSPFSIPCLHIKKYTKMLSIRVDKQKNQGETLQLTSLISLSFAKNDTNMSIAIRMDKLENNMSRRNTLAYFKVCQTRTQ